MPKIFGKKCPQCRTKNFSPRQSKSWSLNLPGIQYFTCSDCQYDFYYIPPYSVLIDKRSSERIKPPNTLLVRFRGHQQQYAKIEDISMDGIGFSYDLDQQKFADETYTIDLYNCKQGTFLKNIPIKVVSTKVSVTTFSGQQTTILRCGARFVRLNRIQKKILKNVVEGFNKDNK